MTTARWHRRIFAFPWPRIPGKGQAHILGWVREGDIWGVVSCSRGEWAVVHRPSGKIVTRFTLQRHAKRFCEEIDTLADWSAPVRPSDPTLPPRLHQIALRLTGGHPDLRVIDGGGP